MSGYGLTIFSGGRGAERYARLGTLAREAEEAGFEGVWVSELYNRSATVPMATLAAATSRVLVGSNIAYGPGRSPLIWAAEARDLDELSEGRLVLGLGTGTRGMLENWLSVSGESPAARTVELVEVLRKLWRLHEGPVRHEGRFYTVNVAPTMETPPPFQEHLPIWTAGVNPGMIRAAGRVADGLVGHPMFTRRYLDEVVRPELAKGAVATGRHLDGFQVMGIRICAVAEGESDLEEARRRAAFAVAQYAASRVYDRLFALHGWTAEQERIREAARAKDPAGMVAAVPDAAIDECTIVCTATDLPLVAARHAEPVDHLVLTPPPWGLDAGETDQATSRIVAAMRPALSPPR
jgi:probable F420-dependent oxidoreductase